MTSEGTAAAPRSNPRSGVMHWFENAVRLVGHADVRWHVWIVLALFARLDLALASYALYSSAGSGRCGEEGGMPWLTCPEDISPIPVCWCLILARDEAANLPGCLASTCWADEVIVVVDRASRDQTELIAKRGADLVAIRTFDDFARQRNAASTWHRAIGCSPSMPTSEAAPELATEIRRRAISDPSAPFTGYRVPIRSIILGRRFRFSGTQNDRPLRLFRRGHGQWIGATTRRSICRE